MIMARIKRVLQQALRKILPDPNVSGKYLY